MSMSLVGSRGNTLGQEFGSGSSPASRAGRFQTGQGVLDRVNESRIEAPQQENQVDESTSSTPTRTSMSPEQGRQVAESLLQQQSSLAQASIQFEQIRETPQMTPQGERRATLQGMTKMAETLYHQHTGGETGESYGKVQLGDMLSTLKGNTGPSAPQFFPVPRGNSAMRAMGQIATFPSALPPTFHQVA